MEWLTSSSSYTPLTSLLPSISAISPILVIGLVVAVEGISILTKEFWLNTDLPEILFLVKYTPHNRNMNENITNGASQLTLFTVSQYTNVMKTPEKKHKCQKHLLRTVYRGKDISDKALMQGCSVPLLSSPTAVIKNVLKS